MCFPLIRWSLSQSQVKTLNIRDFFCLCKHSVGWCFWHFGFHVGRTNFQMVSQHEANYICISTMCCDKLVVEWLYCVMYILSSSKYFCDFVLERSWIKDIFQHETEIEVKTVIIRIWISSCLNLLVHTWKIGAYLII